MINEEINFQWLDKMGQLFECEALKTEARHVNDKLQRKLKGQFKPK